MPRLSLVPLVARGTSRLRGGGWVLTGHKVAGMDDYLAANRALWDEWTAIHETSSFYDLEGFKEGGSRLRAL